MRRTRSEFTKGLDTYYGLVVVGIFAVFILPLFAAFMIAMLPVAAVGLLFLWLMDKTGLLSGKRRVTK